MDQVDTEPVRAAGVIARAPDGSILMVKRVDDGSWAFPGGVIEGDETPEKAAYREFFEETGRRLGSVGKQLMRRIKNDGQGLVDFVTFIVDVDAPFVPILNSEHSAFAWVSPDVTLMESRTECMAVADSATPIVGGGGHAELEQSLAEGLLTDEAERMNAKPENPPMLDDPIYPTADKPVDQPLADESEDDLDDELAERVLEAIGALHARLSAIEDCSRGRRPAGRPLTAPFCGRAIHPPGEIEMGFPGRSGAIVAGPSVQGRC